MTAERDWDDALNEIAAGLQETTARCRCGKRIHLLRGQWEDDDGSIACVKGGGKTPDYPGQSGGAIAREPVFHGPAGTGEGA
jgi:hypothetical protein